MEKSTTISKLATALVLVQGNLKPAIFNAKNPFLKNKYADLGAVVEASRPLLLEHGLAISQFPIDAEGQVGIVTLLMHTSGEYLQEECFLPLTEEKGVNLAQVAGRNITYLRRYSWASVLGMVSEEDTDGNIHSEPGEKSIEKKERVWSIDQMEAVIGFGTVESHEDAKVILDYSVLPETAPIKTIQSWMKYYIAEEGLTISGKASVANEAYIQAKKGSK